jgi:membrane-bound lytic murein transglycosylase
LQRAFPLDIPMVPSSAIAIDGECLTCGGFSLGETVRLGNFELITNYFDGLILSPIRGDTGAAFMGLARSRASTL